MIGTFKKWLLFPKSPWKLATLLILPLFLALGALTFTLVRWEKKSLDDIQISGLVEVGRIFYQHIMSTRIWTSGHGGMYIEAMEDLSPGPTDRDPGLQSLSIMGKVYRKVNAEVLTAGIMDILNQRSGYKFHITSLNPADPRNRPDAWEEESLLAFQRGVRETTTIEIHNDSRVFRYMAPLTLDESCIRCHQWGGYKLADIRGGISINFPMSYSDSLFAGQMKRTALSFATIGVIAIGFMMIIVVFFSKRISEGFNIMLDQEDRLKRLNAQLSEILARDRKIIENIGDGLAVINSRGIVEMANRVLLSAANLQADGVIGRHIADLPEENPLSTALSPYRKSGLKEPENGILDFRRDLLSEPLDVTVGGKQFTATSIFVKNETGEGFFCELRLLHDATQEKLKAIMEVSGAAAHEIRQPLAILMSLKDLIRSKSEEKQDVSEELNILDEQIERVNDIIGRMLSLTTYRTKRYADDMQIVDFFTQGQ